jgi:hypothetical protein
MRDPGHARACGTWVFFNHPDRTLATRPSIGRPMIRFRRLSATRSRSRAGRRRPSLSRYVGWHPSLAPIAGGGADPEARELVAVDAQRGGLGALAGIESDGVVDDPLDVFVHVARLYPGPRRNRR